ncbi:MAG: ATP-binding protein [Halobacteriota archaeon]
MFRKEFVDRRKELEFLDKKYKEQGFEFIIASGRRRTGKSRLLKEFVKDKENIFLLCEERKWQYNLSKFNTAVGKCFGIPNPNFDSFSDCFDFIVKQDRERERLIVVIDEFSYLIKKSDIIAELKEKSGFVDWNNENRNDVFAVIAKRIEGKEELKEEGYLCYDLEDIEDIMKTEGGAR